MSSRDEGLTLVEALVSIFVFALVAAGCVTMLTQGVLTQKRVAEATGELRELQTARTLLSADMSQLALRQTREADGSRAPAFLGGADPVMMAFVRASGDPDPAQPIASKLIFVEYIFDGERILRRTRADLDAVGEGAVVERVLFAKVSDARVEFFDGLRWSAQWLSDDGAAAPAAVALLASTSRYGEIRMEATTGPRP